MTLQDPQTPVLDSPTPPLRVRQPKTIGAYQILEVIGRGGMGTVYLAEQSEPVQRRLAVKLVHRNLSDSVAAARFESERQAMARLSHPNIAQIFDAGTTRDGFPYFAMEYVADGQPITEYCDQHQLTIEERLRLFITVGRGVQHAHQRGILHRDLKPSNILVTAAEGEAMAKIIDFGLAKAVDQPLTGDSQLTLDGSVVGTLEYMSPESFQRDDTPSDPDTRSDVYALGTILYELLCGCRPYETEGMNPLAKMQHIYTHEAPFPSRRLSTTASASPARVEAVAQQRRLLVPALRRRLLGDLDLVVMKAIAHDPDQRYASVADLTTDLERYLGQEPVEAHPPSRTYRMRKFVRRHRTAVVAGVLVLMALVLGTIGLTVGMLRASHEAETARRALGEAEALAGFLEELFRSSEPGNPARDMTTRQILDAGAARIDRGLEGQPEAKARILTTIGDIYMHLALFDQAEPLLIRSLELRQSSIGRQHPSSGRSLLSLGTLRYFQDRHAEAEELLSEALAIFRSQEESPQLALALQRLAHTLRASGDYERSESLYRQSLELYSTVYSDDHPALIDVLNDLGSLMNLQDHTAAGEAFIQRALRLSERHYGPDHARLTRTLRNLSSIARDKGQRAESLELLKRALAIEKKTYGDSHPRVARVLGDLAASYQENGDTVRAQAHYEAAVEVFEQIHGGESMELAIASNNFGTFYWELERYEEAEPWYLRSLEIKKKLLEPDHPSIAHTINNLGLIYWKRGQFEDAEIYLRRALETWERGFGPRHRLVAWPLWGLAGTYRDQGRFLEAEPYYERALSIREDVLPANDPELHKVRSDFAQLLRATGREARAAELEAQNAS